MVIIKFGNKRFVNKRNEGIRMTVLMKNPILRGFYPDPSICRVGED